MPRCGYDFWARMRVVRKPTGQERCGIGEQISEVEEVAARLLVPHRESPGMVNV